jgi:hypothetical protein
MLKSVLVRMLLRFSRKSSRFFMLKEPDHEDVINISEPTERPVGSHFECLRFERLHVKLGYHKRQGRADDSSVVLFTELPVET